MPRCSLLFACRSTMQLLREVLLLCAGSVPRRRSRAAASTRRPSQQQHQQQRASSGWHRESRCRCAGCILPLRQPVTHIAAAHAGLQRSRQCTDGLLHAGVHTCCHDVQAMCRSECAAHPCPQLVLASCTALVAGGGITTERIFKHNPPPELVDRLAAAAGGHECVHVRRLLLIVGVLQAYLFPSAHSS